MGKSVFSILAAFWCLTAHAQSLGVGSEFKNYSNQLDLLFQTRYYKATGNFKSSGSSYDDLPSGYSFQNLSFDLEGRMPLSPKWAIFANGSLGYAEAKNPSTTHTNSALSQAVLGTDFVLTDGQLMLIPELSATIPFSKVNTGSDVTPVSDGALAGNGRLIALIKSNSFRFGGFAGASARDQGLSTLFLYGALAELDFGRWDLGADLRGYSTIGNDKDNDNNSTRTAYFCLAEGCAKRYNAINPALLESNVWTRIQLNPSWDLNGGFGFAITGQNTTTGYSAVAGIVYHMGKATNPSAPAATPDTPAPQNPRPGQRPPAPSFQEETNDGVDQNLFGPTSAPSKRTVAPPPPKPKVNPDAQRKKLRKKMQDDLNKTEMQIELKSSKKKSPPVPNDEY